MLGRNDRLDALFAARVNRRAVLRGAAAAGVALPGLAAFLEACQSSGGGSQSGRPLAPTVYQWVVDQEPAGQQGNKTLRRPHPLPAENAPGLRLRLQQVL